ncbi:hypothetical protein SLA2020_202340 [Shorea laevis]
MVPVAPPEAPAHVLLRPMPAIATALPLWGAAPPTISVATASTRVLTRRRRCQQVIVHPPEVREPLPLTVDHFPIAITFGFFNDESILVIDPTHNEEAVMGGRMTATVNANGDICAIQKAGVEGVTQRVIMQCLQLGIAKAAGITKQIKEAVEAYNAERSLRKIKRHPTSVGTIVQGGQNQTSGKGGVSESPGNHIERREIKAVVRRNLHKPII